MTEQYHAPDPGERPVRFTPEAVPEEIRALPQWLNWTWVERDGRASKHPVSPWAVRSGPCGATDPDSWSTFDHAVTTAAAAGLAGVGFVFTAGDPYLGLDYDDCLNPDTGELHPAVAEEIGELGSYFEVSPSDTGLKGIVRARKPGTRCRTSETPWAGEFEIYDKGRFFTVTGRALDGYAEIADAQAAVERIYQRRFPAATPSPMPHPTPIAAGRGMLSDEAVVRKARRSKGGAKFARLFDHGNTAGYGSPSEADYALLNALCFWCRGDVAQMARLLRRSALWTGERERAKGKDYPERSALSMAESYTGRYYDPGGAAKESAALVEAGMLAPLFTEQWKGMPGATDHDTFTALLIAATENGVPVRDGLCVRPGQHNLAAIAGVSRKTLRQSLRRLQERGLVRLEPAHRARARSGVVILRSNTGLPHLYTHAAFVSISGVDLCKLRDLLRLRWGHDLLAEVRRIGKVAGMLLMWLVVLPEAATAEKLAECLQRRRDSVLRYLYRLQTAGLAVERDGVWCLAEDFWDRFEEELRVEGILRTERRQQEAMREGRIR